MCHRTLELGQSSNSVHANECHATSSHVHSLTAVDSSQTDSDISAMPSPCCSAHDGHTGALVTKRTRCTRCDAGIACQCIHSAAMHSSIRSGDEHAAIHSTASTRPSSGRSTASASSASSFTSSYHCEWSEFNHQKGSTSSIMLEEPASKMAADTVKADSHSHPHTCDVASVASKSSFSYNSYLSKVSRNDTDSLRSVGSRHFTDDNEFCEADKKLFRACESGNIVECHRLLDEEGASPNAHPNQGGITCLMCACSRGHRYVTSLLIEKGANVNAVNKEGNTALMYASRYDHADVIDDLIRAGAYPGHRNVRNWNALDIAVVNNSRRSVDTLVAHGVLPLHTIQLLSHSWQHEKLVNKMKNEHITQCLQRHVPAAAVDLVRSYC